LSNHEGNKKEYPKHSYRTRWKKSSFRVCHQWIKSFFTCRTNCPWWNFHWVNFGRHILYWFKAENFRFWF